MQQYSLMEGGDFMKKALVIIVSVLIVLSVARFSFAEEKKHSTKAMIISGEVTAVDAAANTLTIKGKKGEVVLTTTDKTKFAEGKTLADVKVGDKLSAKYSEKDGKMMAWKVMTKKEMEKKDVKKMEMMEKEQKEKGVKKEIEQKMEMEEEMEKMEKKQKEKDKE
ncbi:exported hypothetical protein [Candidatus Sulfobium mesophilum]|uniref:DUF5666 domain-containing protein n=1 Tax=Candidatus Sulfobium mesophilum TaxID=2016548 RepID=A0A2U3QHN1_9BACT|nr:exported hypothetical protein [Candidatus Sulfobium mesophilum]